MSTFISYTLNTHSFIRDIIRLTALFTARRGKSFISMLGGRENRNPQFDFLRPNHSLFGLFNNFVEQYLKVIKGTSAPLDEEFDKLSLSQKKNKLVDNAKSRSEWEAYKREGLKKREQDSEKETRTLLFAILTFIY